MAYRDLIYGVDGMKEGLFPPFTEYARDLLCKNPDDFRKVYGTHFVKGDLKGASIEMKV